MSRNTTTAADRRSRQQAAEGAMDAPGDAKGGRPLQARVSADVARKFDAVARARGMKDSDLVRYAIDLMLKEAAKDLDRLQESMMRDFEEARRLLEGD